MLVNEEEKRLSLMGIWFRINDKVERIKTILMRGDNGSLKGEGLVDSYSDISNYGLVLDSYVQIRHIRIRYFIWFVMGDV